MKWKPKTIICRDNQKYVGHHDMVNVSLYMNYKKSNFFFKTSVTNIWHLFTDKAWVAGLAYLTDIFVILYVLRLSFHRQDSHVLKSSYKVNEFITNLHIYKGTYEISNDDILPRFADIYTVNDISKNENANALLNNIHQL
ncbi:hypothetical protein RF11_10721 [Thelohanellus kitauei]|uniref:Uncharacterized protein n=1 Tax=Thelohanellus kitauei TaxID=669202 RepID=A0A0C2M9I1_THEKT|nr:hypothetical protein RF11_10721 [Thelohanellus kitauei]